MGGVRGDDDGERRLAPRLRGIRRDVDDRLHPHLRRADRDRGQAHAVGDQGRRRTRPVAARRRRLRPPPRLRVLVRPQETIVELTTVWFALIAVLWIGYFTLEGFDFGVGMLLPVLAEDDRERRVMINTIGPVWDGNEVWLLVAG